MTRYFTERTADLQRRWWEINGQETRRWAFYDLGAFMGPMDTGRMHGPTRDDAWANGAYLLGVERARNAASWCTDGNSDADAIRATLAMLDDGDPEAFDRLPPMPNLSGEWADDPTPRSIFEDVTGLDAHAEASWNEDAYGTAVDALCDAYEAGVSDTFESACEAQLRRAIG